MIIFDLDGTLADCQHRRHFVDPMEAIKRKDLYFLGDFPKTGIYSLKTEEAWKRDRKAFYEACDKDDPVEPVIHMYNNLYFNTPYGNTNYFVENVQIWSGRCESVREKTHAWLCEHILTTDLEQKIVVKMRPIGDSTPDDQLKERWLDELLAQGKTIEYVFDNNLRSINMWRRRGIFVFDCNQNGKEF